MPYQILTRDDHFRSDGRPKRILALDGGGLRGVLSLGILGRIEELLRERHGCGEGFRLCHYFDLIAGTSTGAIIAAALAQGRSVQEVSDRYFSLGQRVFQRSLFRQELLRARYDERVLVSELKDLFGVDTTLGGPQLLTGLLVVIKRLDSGSPWPVSNNPRGRYFVAGTSGRMGNGDYPLWQVVRASTAAPSYFEPESITISGGPHLSPVTGSFVDGGVSPFNNPALQALMYATLGGYRVGWETGGEKLLLVSVGTGVADPAVGRAKLAASHALRALKSVLQDCAVLQETMLQWMSQSPTARVIDRELGTLTGDLLNGAPLMRYLRYNVDLRPDSVRALDESLAGTEAVASLSAMDAPENMEALHRLGRLAAARDVRATDFPTVFDLPPA
ncbi:patatin-like phospholipase family protein [Arthrobacter globiformis]|uniref:patatin-like phospholipase family protein n=1 Tax=Arthrobacter globiformis TaxID=1665 RepID=UPI000B40CBFA|nr:patatin-like phospholipase family protein [Arthrobacter globiformis]